MSRWSACMAGGLRRLGGAVLAAGWLAVGCGDCGNGVGAQTLLSVHITQPSDRQILGTADDADPNAAGLQFDVKAHALDSGNKPFTLQEATLEARATGTEAWTPVASGVITGADVTFPKATLPTGDQELRVTVTDKGLNRTAERLIVVTVQGAP